MSSLLSKMAQPIINKLWSAVNQQSGGRSYGVNPHLTQRHNHQRNFFGGEVDRILNGWVNHSYSIDNYLYRELTPMRARSRELFRQNAYAKKYGALMKVNIVGPKGIQIHAMVKRSNNEYDNDANNAIEAALLDWSQNHCDLLGRKTFTDIEQQGAFTIAQDGEAIAELFEGPAYGPYGFKVKLVDPELLDTQLNEIRKDGNVVRMGVEYDQIGRRVAYHFISMDQYGRYTRMNHRRVLASHIVHAFVEDYPDQSRGIPWLHASLQSLKSHDKYVEAAMTAARYGAAKMVVLSSKGTEDDRYVGDEEDPQDSNLSYEHVGAGEVWDIGTRELQNYDPDYPHEMYASFTRNTVREISTGTLVSYSSLSNDLADVNFSSIRHGVLEERDIYMMQQEFFIRSFTKKIIERWLQLAMLSNAIRVRGAPLARPYEVYRNALEYRARRWHWVDPMKDMQANVLAINNRLKSRSQIMRGQGDDPMTTFEEISRENEVLAELNIMPVETSTNKPTNTNEGDDDAEGE